MQQDFGTKPPLEARLEQRTGKLAGEVKDTANDMKQGGLSERAIAGYFSTIEYLNDLMDRSDLKGADKEKLILEVQAAVRTLVHGMIMGDGAQRHQEQLNIANGNGELAKQVGEALRKANKTGTKGGNETTMVSEHEV